MTEQPHTQPHTQPQGIVLAVHTSQLTHEGVAQLAREGYGILPDQTGWLVFVRLPNQSTVESRESTEGPADAPSVEAPEDLPPHWRGDPAASRLPSGD